MRKSGGGSGPLLVSVSGTGALDVFFSDQFLNPPGTTSNLSVTRTGGVGTFGVSWGGFANGNGTIATTKDGFGANGPQRKLVGLHLRSTCGGTGGREPICVWQTYFDSWSSGYVGTINITGAPPPTTSTFELDSWSVNCITNGNGVTVSYPVSMEH